MRVLRISHSGNVSAYRERERALHATSEVEIALVCPSDWQHLGQSDTDIEEEFLTRQAKTIGTGSIPLFAYEMRPIVQMLKQLRPDVVDIHEEPYSVSGFECLLLARRFAPDAAYVIYSAQNINKRYPVPFRLTEQYVHRNCHGAYPCSTGVQEVLRAKGFSKPCPVIPLGVDPDVFTPDGRLLKDWRLDVRQCYVIGFTGRLIDSKGLQVVLQAMSLLHGMMPEHAKVKLLVAGAGPAQEKLAESARALGVNDSIEWLGELKQTEMPAFYRSCHVIVVPSITTATWKEQFGRVPVEAMSCDVPVVVSDSGSLPEVVQDAGIIVKEQDPQALAEALAKVLSDANLRESCQRQGQALVRSKYTWQAVAEEMLKLYRQVGDTRKQGADVHVSPIK